MPGSRLLIILLAFSSVWYGPGSVAHAEWPLAELSRRRCLGNGWEWYERADGKTFCTIPLKVQDRVEQAVRDGDRAYVEDQLSRGLPVDLPMNMYYGSPILLVALEHGQCDIAALLLAKGADVKLLPGFVREPQAPCSHLLDGR